MAKIISQYSFADYGVIEILGDLERFLCYYSVPICPQ